MRGLTLIEMIIVVIIIGILATLAVPQYLSVKERALDKEAQANLAAIQAAEKNYRIEKGSYFIGFTAGLNTNLKLMLPATTNRAWNYQVLATDEARATRRFGPNNLGRYWSLLLDSSVEPSCVPASADPCR